MRPNTHTHRLAAEHGFVMLTAIAVMFALLVLTTVTIAVSVGTSVSTTHDNDSKAALAAAETGLQMADYRLKELVHSESKCLESSSAEATPQTSGSEKGYCKVISEEQLGNGATFQYQTSEALTVGKKCAGKTIEAVPSGTIYRCIVAIGKGNGLAPVRLEELVSASPGTEQLFSVKGILGLSEVLVSGSVKATAIVASDEKIIGEGSAAFEKGFEYCPGGEFKPKAGKERNKSGVTVHGVGGEKSVPEYEIERKSSECPITAALPKGHATATENEDSRISKGEDPNTGEAKSLVYNASKYELELGANVKLTLKGSKYYFCKFVISSNGELKIPSTGKVEIFIDSHADNSACPKETKELTKGEKVTPKFEVSGNTRIETPGGPDSLLIEMAGEGPIDIGASGAITASIYAPEAEVVLSGAGSLTGAITGKKVHLTAGSFIYSNETEKLTVSSETSGNYTRTGWDQCTSSTTATPEQGC